MTTRAAAFALLAAYLAALAFAVQARGGHGGTLGDFQRAALAIRAEFGTGWLAGCMLRIAQRETGGTFDAHAANWRDHHADGSRGSFGLMGIGALWRDPGESVEHFARRMFQVRENVRLAHHVYDVQGLSAWRGC